MGYIAGHFTFKWSPTWGSAGYTFTDVGSTKDGFNLRVSQHEQNIHDDAFGDAIPDMINEGQDHILQLTWIEYDKLIAGGLPFVQTPKGFVNSNVGKTLSSLSGAIEATPVPGTPAATVLGTGKSYLFFTCVPITDIEFMLNSKAREGPLTIRCLPDPTNSNKAFRDDFTTV